MCRFPPISTTHLHYNFADTSFLLFLCAVKWTLLFDPPLLGRRRQRSKQGAEQSLFVLLSLPPFSPHPSSLFCPLAPFIVAPLTLCLACFHPNSALSLKFFGSERAVFEPFLLLFGPLFFVTGPSTCPFPSPNACLSLTSCFFFYSRVFWTQLFFTQKQSKTDKDPKRYPTPSVNPYTHSHLHHDPNYSLSRYWGYSVAQFGGR